MGIAGNSLDLIRTVFNRNNVLPLPSSYWDQASRGSFYMQQGFAGQTGGSNGQIADSVRIEEDLMNRYADYDEMDAFPELGAAIDLFADDATVQDVMSQKSMWFESTDESIDHVLNDMLEVNLKVENELWEIARSLCKYGNEFIEPVVLDQVGVVKLNHSPAPWMRRIEDINGILYGYMQDPAMTFTIDTRTFLDRIKNKGMSELELPQGLGTSLLQVYEPWEIVHMRLRSRARRDLYGYSVVEAARYAWKRLAMMEDAMLMYKVTRSPQRYAFYVDVGDVPPNQARGLLNRIKNDFKKNKFIDSNGKPNFRYSPLCLSLDTKIPVINIHGEAPLKGAVKTLSELIADHEAGIKNWTYSINVENGELVKGEIVWAGVTRKDAEVLSVVVNEKEMVVTPDHKFLLNNLEYKEAKDLIHTDKVLSIDPISKKTFSQNITAVGKIKDNQDTGCITVEMWHNFALDSGVFVKNSAEDDFFIPVRKDRKGTEIEVLAGPEGQSVEDVQYFLNKIFAALKIPKSYLGADETVGRANLCLVPETKVVLTDGRHLTMEQLILEYSQGIENFVYSIDEKSLAVNPGKIIKAEWTRKNADVVRVHISGNITVDSTPDHLFMLRDGSYIEASSLKENDELMSFGDQHVRWVEILDQKRDCCDIQIEGSPNFALASGVYVHNSQLDVRLCRSVMRIQRELKNGFRQIGRIDLAAKNIDPDRTSFECHMVIPSGVFELAQIEVEKAKLDLGAQYREANFSEYWVYSKILGLSDEEILQIQTQRVREKEGNITTEDAERLRSALPRMVDRAADRSDPRAREFQQRILDEVESGNTHIGRRLHELKMLTNEVRGSIRNQKRTNGKR